MNNSPHLEPDRDESLTFETQNANEAVKIVKTLHYLSRIVTQRYGAKGDALGRHIMWTASAVWAAAYPEQSDELEGIVDDAHHAEG